MVDHTAEKTTIKLSSKTKAEALPPETLPLETEEITSTTSSKTKLKGFSLEINALDAEMSQLVTTLLITSCP